MKKNIIIGFLTVIIITLCAFLFYDKIFYKKKIVKKVKKEEKIEENLDIIAQYLVNKLDKYFVDFYNDKGDTDFTSVEYDDLLMGAYMYGESGILSKNIVDDYYKNLFNISLKTYPDLNCFAGDGVLFKYNMETGDYESSCGNSQELCHSHGGVSIAKSLITKYNSIIKNGDDYVITVTKVFGLNLTDSDGYFYADYNYKGRISGLDSFVDNTKNTNSIGQIDVDRVNIEDVKKYYDQHYDLFKNIKPQYRYTFKKVNNDYFLTKNEFIG